ncbi:MAG: hypothetical protein A2Y82_02660 [Candidatus Buchananbacteria bacterium RBG_13_36_9]|uniref:Uncharacterized protein n=1 Tax=Candidatus Buchananbacteria bacterium RBG_13_36_9 TaxID=1797530 RepID=A0A1G1XP81_9BACT|nr:MAG: hypothetical protein A2Y82_02660 [Candidatus Buchananbacteria bacterium RBG_13_36_9]
MAQKQWSLREILKDLENLKMKGKKPDPYELKSRYGYELNSEFFPILDAIYRRRGMKRFVRAILDRAFPGDLAFRAGRCNCPACRGED